MAGAERLSSEAEQVWAACVDILRSRLPESTWQTSLASVRAVSLEDDRLVLAVPNGVVRDRIQARHLADLHGALEEAAGMALDVSLEVRPDLEPGADDSAPPAWAGTAAGWGSRPGGDVSSGLAGPQASPGRAREGRLSESTDAPLNPNYTFDAFVIGSSNRFAHAAALSVAETPARSYNPLFIYGGAGLGKTHLLHAIGHYVLEHYPGLNVRYVTTETFLNEFVDAIRTNTTTAFKRRYRESHVLLIDDVQFIENKERFQEEFFHTFNSLHDAGRQIVISSDRPPRSISTLEDRLRSRFEWGLITDVQPPELETRLAILRKKVEDEKADVPDDVLDYIATHVTDNIRELEGALNRVWAYGSLTHEAIDLALAERILAELLAHTPRQVTPKAILDTTAEMFGLSVEDLCGKSRSHPLVTARQIGMYVFRQLTDFSYPAIGREFGDRDHTTVMHAVEKITTLMREKRVIYDQVTELVSRIMQRG